MLIYLFHICNLFRTPSSGIYLLAASSVGASGTISDIVSGSAFSLGISEERLQDWLLGPSGLNMEPTEHSLRFVLPCANY